VLKWFCHPAAWLKELTDDAYAFIRHFIAEVDGQPIGFCQYYDYALGGEQWHNGTDIEATVSIDYMIGETAYLGRRLGSQIVRALEEKIRQETTARKIIVQPDRENAASRGTLRSVGYTYDAENDLFVKLL